MIPETTHNDVHLVALEMLTDPRSIRFQEIYTGFVDEKHLAGDHPATDIVLFQEALRNGLDLEEEIDMAMRAVSQGANGEAQSIATKMVLDKMFPNSSAAFMDSGTYKAKDDGNPLTIEDALGVNPDVPAHILAAFGEQLKERAARYATAGIRNGVELTADQYRETLVLLGREPQKLGRFKTGGLFTDEENTHFDGLAERADTRRDQLKAAATIARTYLADGGDLQEVATAYFAADPEADREETVRQMAGVRAGKILAKVQKAGTYASIEALEADIEPLDSEFEALCKTVPELTDGIFGIKKEAQVAFEIVLNSAYIRTINGMLEALPQDGIQLSDEHIALQEKRQFYEGQNMIAQRELAECRAHAQPGLQQPQQPSRQVQYNYTQ